MPKLFEHYHFSLLERDQTDFLEPTMSREEWLKAKFGQAFEFRHMGKTLHWVPRDEVDRILTAIVERKRVRVQHKSPEEGAAEFEGEEWQGSIVLIDPMHRPGGQKVAFEDDPSVGQSSAILASIVAHMNSNLAHQYTLHVNPIWRGDSFWKFAQKHGHKVAYVSFKFTVPNMIFGVGTKTTDGLKRIGKDTGGQEVDLRIASDEGVDTRSEAVREGVEYAEEGNARVTSRAMNGDYFTSTRKKMSAKMHSLLDLASMSKERAKEWIEQALGRDADSGDNGVDSDSPDLGRD